MSDPRTGELAELLRSHAWLLRVLRAVRDERIPDAWVGAGVLRDLVWGERFGSGFRPEQVHDVDVAFFDPHDLRRDHDDDAIEVCAPLGLADLLDGVWRRNPRRAGLAVSLARLERHRPGARWPRVRVETPSDEMDGGGILPFFGGGDGGG